MKTFKLFSMAALALVMAACSNEDSALENAAPAQQQGAMKFTATLAAPGSGATTRTVYTEVTSGADAGKIKVAWKAGDQIYLNDLNNGAKCTATVGSPAADGSATISGTFDNPVGAGHNITATYPTSAVNDDFNAKFASQAGTLAYIQDNLDYRIGTSTISVDGDQATLATALQMESQIAIWKLTLQDNAATPAALSATKVTIKNGSTVIAATTDISAKSAVYLALNLKSGNISSADITIEATVGSDTYTYSKSGVSLAKGNYYQSTVKMSPIISLSSRTFLDDELVIADGYIVTGFAVGFSCKVAVADGATVTLRDVENDGKLDGSSACPGIKCLGDATIILEGNNTVTGGYTYAGIYVPKDKTLTIRGTGSLTVTGGSSGAGIGGNGTGDANCGSIVISGGTITATGGSGGAGIGLGYSSGCVFGDITISGGTVTATGSGDAPGIGGPYAYFQNITITNGVTKVTVNKGSSSPYSIGTSEIDEYGSYGAITIGGTVYLNGVNFENGGDSYLKTSPLVYPAPAL